MHCDLFFSGDSWTYGSELQGKENDREHRRTHRFSYLVGKKLNKTFYNLGIPGGSNDEITRKTIEWFESGNSCDTAIIQLTTTSRVEYVYQQDKEKPITLSFLSSSGWSNRLNLSRNITRILKKIRDDYYKNFYNDCIGLYNFHKNIFILEQYFESRNIKYYFLKYLSENNFSNFKILSDGFCWENVCKNNYFKIPTLMNGIVPKEDMCPDYRREGYKPLMGLHPNEIGHEKIANYIIENFIK